MEEWSCEDDGGVERYGGEERMYKKAGLTPSK